MQSNMDGIPTEDLMLQMENKLQALMLIEKDTPRILSRGKLWEVERQLRTFEDKIKEAQDLKLVAREQQINQKKTLDEIWEWSAGIDEKLEKFDATMEKLEHTIVDINSSNAPDEEQKKLVKKQDEEKKFEEMRKQLRLDMERQMERNAAGTSRTDAKVNVKLPKMDITKFKGTHLDWQRFWNQFEAEVDKASIAQVSKFSYLKEMVVPKVRLTIDGLPFTTEGYERAKAILKKNYGEASEVVNAHVHNIMMLPTIQSANPAKVKTFFEKLISSVQALETMGKLQEIKGNVRMTLDKLPGIRADLVRLDDDWKSWGFVQLVEALRKWTERNPTQDDGGGSMGNSDKSMKKDRHMNTKTKDWRKKCVYCESLEHRSFECTEIKDVDGRKKVLSEKKLCFNCTGPSHRAFECRSGRGCQTCNGKHHTSICDKNGDRVLTTSKMLTTREVMHPVVVVEIEGVKCRALLDTGAGSSYASSTLVKLLKKKPSTTERRCIEMMMTTKIGKIDIYDVVLSNLKGDFKLETKVGKVDKPTLLTLPNPRYNDLIKQYGHLANIVMEDTDTRAELPIHLVLGASEYSKIKTPTKPRIGRPGEPIAELTTMGWTIMSPGTEADLTSVYLTKSTVEDYDRLCRLDVLGLEDYTSGDQREVYKEFREQLKQTPEGWYETNLMWKVTDKPLLSNKSGSLARLRALLWKLEKNPEVYEEYDNVIQQQLTDGIIERVTDDVSKGKEFYIPHKPVIREAAESTKLRIVFDASARENSGSASLNDCLETGPALQNSLWEILIRNRMKPIAVTGDIKQAFLQIRIREDDRDALRFHWISDKKTKEVVTFRFTRALFGLVQSPFLLGGTIETHLENKKEDCAQIVEEITDDIYVDDLVSGANTVEEAKQLKEDAKEIFKDAGFQLHKWHSNTPTIEDVEMGTSCNGQGYAKQKLGVGENETKILGISWDKTRDVLKICFPEESSKATKRGILKKLASIFDPLGIVSPITLLGKFLYRDSCDQKLDWDAALPSQLSRMWIKWEQSLPLSIEVPRSLPLYREEINALELHAFGDASKDGVSAAVYAVVIQSSGTNQGLLTSKSRLAKRGMTIPRLELVGSHMGANLVQNVKKALPKLQIRAVYGWTDSMVALHWIREMGNYKQFVQNRVRSIREKDFIQWRYVPSKENPTDIGSRGCTANKLPKTWFDGPSWLSKPDEWPMDVHTEPTEESQRESKLIQEVLATAVIQEDEFDKLLQKFTLKKTMRITAWISRFTANCKRKKDERTSGPLNTSEIQYQMQWWIKRTQEKVVGTQQFQDDQQRLNLQKNKDDIYECRGRIDGDYPTYLPDKALFSEKLVFDAHMRTLHGGVPLTMTEIRQKFWIPRLRQLTKRVIRGCNGCKRYQAIAFAKPAVGNLPRDRTEGVRAFQVIGVDFAGPIQYLKRKKQLGKAYILLSACSLSRAIHLDLLPDQTVDELISSLKQFIARRGRPQKIYSDNAKTFEAASKWIKMVMKSEKLQGFLADEHITWQFNLSRAPWWGGQFERLIGVVKQSLYKVLGKSTLTWSELKDVITDIEIVQNNRPLSYVEDDLQLPIITPNSLVFGKELHVPEDCLDAIENADIRKRAKHLMKCKEQMWSRWKNEYIKALRERHNLKHDGKPLTMKRGDVVLIHGDERNRGKWNIGIVERLIPGKDGVVRAVKLRAGKSYLERAVQHLYPLELACDRDEQSEIDNQPDDVQRPKRSAAAISELLSQSQMEEENSVPTIE